MGWVEFSLKRGIMIMNAVGRLFAGLYYGNAGTSIKRVPANASMMKSDLPRKGLVWHC